MARATPYNRDDALDAAMSVFWDKGFHATSLKDLESSLSMKPGSIYAAFDSKENLYLLALERYFQNSLAGFRQAMAQSPSPLSGLADQIRGYANPAAYDAVCQPCMLVKTLVDTRTTDPAIVEKSREYLDAMRQEFSTGFSNAIDAGELPTTANPDRLARRYQANIAALRFEIARDAPAEDIQFLAEDMASEIKALRVS